MIPSDPKTTVAIAIAHQIIRANTATVTGQSSPPLNTGNIPVITERSDMVANARLYFVHHGQPGCVEEYSFPHLPHLMTSEGISARDENVQLGESLVGLYSSIQDKPFDCI